MEAVGPRPPPKKRRSRNGLEVSAHEQRYAAVSQLTACFLEGNRASYATVDSNGLGPACVRKRKVKAALASWDAPSTVNTYSSVPMRELGRELDASRREAIRFVFQGLLGSPPQEEWGGREGTVSIIRNKLEIPINSTRSVEKVLRDLTAIEERNDEEGTAEIYDPRACNHERGRDSLIVDCSGEGNVVCDAVASGIGLGQTTVRVNQFRQKCNPPRPPVSYGAVPSKASQESANARPATSRSLSTPMPSLPGTPIRATSH